jgi:hypothetical protein
MGIVSSLICLFGGTRTNAVCHLQAQLSTALLRGGVDLRPTGNVANPEGSHEFEPREPVRFLGLAAQTTGQSSVAHHYLSRALALGQAAVTGGPAQAPPV